MKYLPFFLWLFPSFAILNAQAAHSAIKERIHSLEFIDCVNEGPAAIRKLELAKAYVLDQNMEKAFTVFLEALENSAVETEMFSETDETFYQEALAFYLDPHAQSTKDTASDLLRRFEPVLKEHPECIQVSLLMAASYANMGRYRDFFALFFQAYPYASHHYLAYKTKAIIHIKLFEKACTAEQKESEQQKIVAYLQKASEKYPRDHSLYKMMVAFSPPAIKDQMIKSGLKKIVDDNIVIPRTDLVFFVEMAAKHNEFESAQLLLDKARQWYPYSRIINAAQQFLDEEEKRN